MIDSLASNREIARRPRLGSIDLLRGLFIVIMTIDHVARFPSGYDFLSGRGSLWFSAAEGFVTISGLLVGYIYAHKILDKPKEIVKKLYRRAAVLYIAVVGLAVFFMLYTHFVLHEGDFIPESSSFISLLFQLLTLQYSFGWAEFLTHYVIFLLLAPAGLYLIAKGRTAILFALSCAVWIAFLWSSDGQTRYEFTASWQFLFFLGMIAGAHLLSINAKVRGLLSQKTIHRLTYGLWGVALVLFITSSYFSYGATMLSQVMPALNPAIGAVDKVWQPFNESILSWLTDKSTAGPVRVLFGVIVFWALFTLFHRFAIPIHRLTNGFLLTLGRQPLFAYCFGAVVIFFVEKYIPIPGNGEPTPISNFIVTSIVLLIVYYFTRLFTRYSTTKSLRSPEFKESLD